MTGGTSIRLVLVAVATAALSIGVLPGAAAAESRAWVNERITSTFGLGEPAVARDASGQLHLLAVRSGAQPGVWYHPQSSGWRPELVEAVRSVTQPSIVVDRDGLLHAAYLVTDIYGEPRAIHYRVRTADGWEARTTPAGGRDDRPQLHLDAHGRVHLTFVRPSDSRGEAIHNITLGDTPGSEEILPVPEPCGGQYPAVTVDDGGHLRAALSCRGALRLVSKGRNGWVSRPITTTVPGRTTYDVQASIAVGSDGRTVVAFSRIVRDKRGALFVATVSGRHFEITRLTPFQRGEPAPTVRIDTTGRIQILYYRAANDQPGYNGVYLARQVSNGWRRQRVAGGHPPDSNGSQVAFTPGAGTSTDVVALDDLSVHGDLALIRHDVAPARPVGPSLIKRALIAKDARDDLGNVVVDGAGRTHVVFRRSGSGILIGREAAGGWQLQGVTDDFRNVTPSLAVLADGSEIVVLRQDGVGLWKARPVEGGALVTAVTSDPRDENPAVMVHPDGFLRVAFFRRGVGVMVATESPGGWRIANVFRQSVPDAWGSPRVDIAMDAGGSLHLAWTSGWDPIPRVRYATDLGGTWAVDSVAVLAYPGDASIAVASTGHVHLVVPSSIGRELRYYTRTAGTWSLVSGSDDPDRAEGPDAARVLVDSRDRVFVVFSDPDLRAKSPKLWIWEWVEDAWAMTPVFADVRWPRVAVTSTDELRVVAIGPRGLQFLHP